MDDETKTASGAASGLGSGAVIGGAYAAHNRIYARQEAMRLALAATGGAPMQADRLIEEATKIDAWITGETANQTVA